MNTISVGELQIPEDLFEGTSCLEAGVPWQVKESILFEFENIKPTDIAFEVGTGGSTIFLARRCAHVYAVETNPDWAQKVSDKIKQEGIENVTYLYIGNEESICYGIAKDRVAPIKGISILSVDTQGSINRSAILETFLCRKFPCELRDRDISDALRMIVVDNYSHEEIFPLHYNKKIIDSVAWELHTFDHPRWGGSGTQIYLKK